jgi:hypothetical protein
VTAEAEMRKTKTLTMLTITLDKEENDGNEDENRLGFDDGNVDDLNKKQLNQRRNHWDRKCLNQRFCWLDEV